MAACGHQDAICAVEVENGGAAVLDALEGFGADARRIGYRRAEFARAGKIVTEASTPERGCHVGRDNAGLSFCTLHPTEYRACAATRAAAFAQYLNATTSRRWRPTP